MGQILPQARAPQVAPATTARRGAAAGVAYRPCPRAAAAADALTHGAGAAQAAPVTQPYDSEPVKKRCTVSSGSSQDQGALQRREQHGGVIPCGRLLGAVLDEDGVDGIPPLLQ